MSLFKKTIVMSCVVAFAILSKSCLANDKRPSFTLGSAPKANDSSGASRTYDEWFTRRQDVYTKDPYIWVYNESFAKAFHMPERWVDSELKGADALAFRMGSAFPLCGWGRNPESCKQVKMCLVEMYFQNSKNSLPWNKHLRWTDLQVNLTSMWTLSSLRPMDRSTSQDGGRKSPLADPASGIELDWWFVLASRPDPYGGPAWVAYDRSAFEDYSLVVLDTRCPSEEIAKLELRSFSSLDPSGKVFREIIFPKLWRARMDSWVRKENEQDRLFFQRRLSELKDGGKSR